MKKAPLQTFMLATLRGYKRFVSPGLSASCRFVPTCSDYAAEAVARHGVFFGSTLAAWRLVRCNPFSQGGLDLVPNDSHIHNQNQSQAVGCSPADHAGRPCL